MTKKNIWYFTFSSATAFILILCIVINYAGRFINSFLQTPLWMDSVGTILCGFFLGPIGGAIAGFATNFLYGSIQATVFLYSIVSIAIGVIAGLFGRTRYFTAKHGYILLCVALILSCALISTPINIAFTQGLTGNMPWDKILEQKGNFIVLAFFAEVAAETADKTLSVFIAYLFYKTLSPKVKYM